MTTLKDFLSNFGKIDPAMFQQVLTLSFAIIFFTWAFVSFIVVIAKGGSLFEENCGSGYNLIWKYAPPLWRKITQWVWRIEFGLVVLYLASVFIWHHQ